MTAGAGRPEQSGISEQHEDGAEAAVVDRLAGYLEDFEHGWGCGDLALAEIERHFGITLPEDYKAFMRRFNGGEGWVREDAFLKLWSVYDLVERNEDLQSERFTPGVARFGSGAGTRVYGFLNRGVPHGWWRWTHTTPTVTTLWKSAPRWKTCCGTCVGAEATVSGRCAAAGSAGAGPMCADTP